MKRGPSLRAATGAVLAGLVAAAVVAAPATAQPKRGGTLTTITTGFRTLNPGVQSGAATGVPGSQIFAGLVQVGDGYKPQPYLAESWSVSDDGLTFTFKLRTDATFHDGKPVTAEDVAFSFDVVKNNHPFGRLMFGNLDQVTTPDAHTVVVKLSKPTPSFMQSLQPLLMPIMPKHVYGDGQDVKKHPRNNENVVGSGPFKVVENKKGEHLILERYDGFFRKGRPYLDRIVVRTMKEAGTRFLAFDTGEADYYAFTGYTPREVKRLQERKDVTVTDAGYGAIGHVNYLELNLRRKPFDDVRVREAIAHAIDHDFIVDTLFQGVSRVSLGPIHSGGAFYVDGLPKYNGGIEKAKALLDEAGLKPGPDGVRFKMTLEIPNWGGAYLGVMASYLRPQLKKVGIDVVGRKSPDFGTWVKRVSSWDYDATMNAAWNYPDPLIGVHRLYSCDNIRNIIWTNTEGYCNKEVDAIMAKAGSSLDQAERAKLYGEFQRILAKDLPFVYLTEEKFTTVFHNYVKGVPLGPWGALSPWDEVYLDK
ncbi:MAG: ABC transporter substrate-binding protein [Hyphomicrobiales bacterium]|nr:ABC transporter substrate-binding protein [Hyphomicrobiales bacterium]MCP5372676.1 ABC transporter substrate-binding protein [Hyphomicrobiales bacterium]